MTVLKEFSLELTPSLWDTLNPNPTPAPGVPYGTVWYITENQYFHIWYSITEDSKLQRCFTYHDIRLKDVIVVNTENYPEDDYWILHVANNLIWLQNK